MIATQIIESLILDLVEWAGRKKRSYQAAMDAWCTSYPRFPVWENAIGRGLVETASANGRRFGSDNARRSRSPCGKKAAVL